jgi:hypothetical protein
MGRLDGTRPAVLEELLMSTHEEARRRAAGIRELFGFDPPHTTAFRLEHDLWRKVLESLASAPLVPPDIAELCRLALSTRP